MIRKTRNDKNMNKNIFLFYTCTKNLLKLFPRFAKVSVGIWWFNQWVTCVRCWLSLDTFYLNKTYYYLGYITNDIGSSNPGLFHIYILSNLATTPSLSPFLDLFTIDIDSSNPGLVHIYILPILSNSLSQSPFLDLF